MAVVDANFNFISIDVDAYGREADPIVFWDKNYTQIYFKFLNIEHCHLRKIVVVLMTLGVYLITDYQEQGENSRMCVREFCDDIEKTFCILHNFVRKRDGCNYEETEENFIVQLNNLQFHGRNVTSGGIETRDFILKPSVDQDHRM
ncbi:protein ALP1-like [Aphis craccivora]|uniref:Protein ALP1-like n=1 Tax=Aphis craccivora TaxID=307492 RepID=A0A6G0YX27_APHCR|nr:protein ALP1-like [Aphis craccivora]